MTKYNIGDIIKETYRCYPALENYFLVIESPNHTPGFVYKVINLNNGQVQGFNPDYARSSWKYEVVA